MSNDEVKRWEVVIFCEVDGTEAEVAAMDPKTVLELSADYTMNIEEIEGDDDDG